jgi:predicted signal transduction protein with EAL and GGDEF domain
MVGYCISLLTLLLFMRQMLNTWKIIPRIDMLIKIQIGLLLISPIGLFISFGKFIKPIILLCLITIIMVISTSVLCAIKRQRSAYYFVVAFLMLCIGGIMMIMRSFNLIASNEISTNGLQFGSALEMLLLGLALADRFNNIRKEKEKAQKEALEAQNLLLENLKSQERLLKERVEERTIALSKSNSALIAANVELEEKRIQLEQLAVTDRLTGLYNRFMLDHVLETELYRCEYHASQFALVLLDIDHFKLVNDNYGHPVGDQVLIEFDILAKNAGLG